jgi:tetratricopeptide (TPR) repeat protein
MRICGFTSLCLLAALAAFFGCGPGEPAGPVDEETREWADGFVARRDAGADAESMETLGAGGRAVDLEELDRRILHLSPELLAEGTAEADELLQDLRRGIRIAASRGYTAREAAYRVGLAVLYRQMGFTDPALEALESVPGLVDDGSGEQWIAAAYSMKADILRSRERITDALVGYDGAFHFCADRDLWDQAHRSLGAIEAICSASRYLDRVREISRPGGELEQQTGDGILPGYCHYLLRREDDIAAAYRALERTEKLARQENDGPWLSVVLSRKGLWELQNGFVSRAIRTYGELSALQTHLGDKPGLLWTFIRFGAAWEYHGDPVDEETARRMYRLAVGAARETGEEYAQAIALHYLGLNLFRHGRLTLGLPCLLEAAAIAERVAPDSDISAQVAASLASLPEKVGGEAVYAELETRVRNNFDALLEQATAQ